jgi:CheY-like chemotaxis protein
METLRAGGAEVTVTPSAAFAITMLEHNRHDVVVSRARTEDLNGHELCAILKADPGTRDVRFVLVAEPHEVTSADTTAAGVDLVLPSAMAGTAIVPLILRLIQADRAPALGLAGLPSPRDSRPAPAAAPVPPAPAAPEVEPEPAVPRMGPAPMAPPQAEPPRRYATAVAAAAAEPWSPSASPTAGGLTEGDALPPPPRIAPPPEPTPDPVAPAPAAKSVPAAPAPPVAAPAVPAPVTARVAASPPAHGPLLAPRPAAPAPAPDLLAMPAGTFQGSLEAMELADLIQAVAAGGKSGRLILALPQGGGLLVFDKGRVVHAEFRDAVGEAAFGALLAACHADNSGRFCFLPAKGGPTPGTPHTIDKPVDRLLLSSATAIDEKG